ncbi:hypothetical protein L3Y34_019098 [Caenorhabditis briggsae]|uniref:Uncharacterized protein n=1 Tax=Caenorhabditis briggsae TaxID=6238 RepID=A0AAE9DM19_CAEBR|nr:hypothetical protein L3Y34_019098 [Caenorhabditis briggsae]
MTSQQLHQVKSDPANKEPALWEGPPLEEMEKLPEVDPKRSMTLSEYTKRVAEKKGLYKPGQKDDTLKKVICNEIGKLPEMWNTKNTNNQLKYYSMVGVEVYKRTGKLVSPQSLTAVFKFAKDAVRSRVKTAIVSKRLNPQQVEELMWRWPYYGFIRFYRKALLPWEAFIKKQMNAKDVKDNVAHTLDDEDFDVEEVDYETGIALSKEGSLEHVKEEKMDYSPEPEMKFEPLPPSEVPVQRPNRPTQRVPPPQMGKNDDPYTPQRNYVSVMQAITRGLQSSGDDENAMRMNGAAGPSRQSGTSRQPLLTAARPPTLPVPTPASQSPPPLPQPPRPEPKMYDFAKEMEQITYHALRIAQEHPERVKMLRKALFTTVFAAEDKDYQSAREMFQDLADNSR